MKRRNFLKAIATVGAGSTLPAAAAASPAPTVPDAQKVETVIDHYFSVSDWGIVSLVGYQPPEVMRECWDDSLGPPANLCVSDIRTFSPLQRFVKEECRRAMDARGPGEFDADDYAEESWDEWFENLSAKERADLNQAIDDWLDGGIDWEQENYDVGLPCTADEAAWWHFENKGLFYQRLVGVSSGEAGGPGNSLTRSFLSIPVEEANARAEKAQLPIRFVKE